MFAVWCDKNDTCQRVLLCCGVQDEDKDADDIDFSAVSIGDYMFDELELVGCDFESIEFISGDNTSMNPKLARLINQISQNVRLIGCASHDLID